MRIKILSLALVALVAFISGCSNDALPLEDKAVQNLYEHIDQDVMIAQFQKCTRKIQANCVIDMVYPLNEQFDSAGYSLDKTVQKIFTDKNYQAAQYQIFGELLTGLYYGLSDETLRKELVSNGVVSEETVSIYLKQMGK